jgi:hypothetical protein
MPNSVVPVTKPVIMLPAPWGIPIRNSRADYAGRADASQDSDVAQILEGPPGSGKMCFQEIRRMVEGLGAIRPRPQQETPE